VAPRDLRWFGACRDYWETHDHRLERLRFFTVLTDHQWSAGPQLQFRQPCSRARDEQGDKEKKRRRKLEMRMESDCDKPEA